MLPETVFSKMASANFSSEQSVCVTQMLFEAAEAGFDKAMQKLEETISNMQTSMGKAIIEAVSETEEKIFARIAAEVETKEEMEG